MRYRIKIMKMDTLLRLCALIWICSFPIAFGTIALTNGDFTKLGALLEQPHMAENYIIVKLILNIGLNLHIATAIPSALAFFRISKKKEKLEVNI